jgi:formylglycine-generating enzyme required for sulfatase activity
LVKLRLFVIFLAVAFASAAQAQEHKDREFKECKDCPIMVGIPAGDFAMGSPSSERGRFDTEGPLHRVTLKAFAFGKYDVTSEQFLAFLRDTGYQPAPCNPILKMTWRSPGDGHAYPPYDIEPRRWPAVCLDWKDANAYIAWLNDKVRKPGADPAKGPYRLPTEAEWEYAARGGTTTTRWWGDEIGTGNANCNGCGSKWDNSELADVDALRPNPFGLYGILGNAWQWTADCWHPNYVDAPTNGSAWIAGGDCKKHVLRGGSWDNLPIFVRAATRSGGTADGGEYDYSSLAGFRIARNLP